MSMNVKRIFIVRNLMQNSIIKAKAYLTKKNRVEDEHYKTHVDFGLSREHHIMMLLLPFQHMSAIPCTFFRLTVLMYLYS